MRLSPVFIRGELNHELEDALKFFAKVVQTHYTFVVQKPPIVHGSSDSRAICWRNMFWIRVQKPNLSAFILSFHIKVMHC